MRIVFSPNVCGNFVASRQNARCFRCLKWNYYKSGTEKVKTQTRYAGFRSVKEENAMVNAGFAMVKPEYAMVKEGFAMVKGKYAIAKESFAMVNSGFAMVKESFAIANSGFTIAYFGNIFPEFQNYS